MKKRRHKKRAKKRRNSKPIDEHKLSVPQGEQILTKLQKRKRARKQNKKIQIYQEDNLKAKLEVEATDIP